MNRIKVYGYALLALSLLLASAIPIAFILGNSIAPLTLLFYVTIVGTVVSFAIMYAKGTTAQLKGLFKDKKYLMAIVTLAILAYVIEPFAFGYGTHYVNADLAAVAFRTWPIMLIFLAPLVIRERITKWDVIGVVIGFMGLAITLIGGTVVSLPVTALPFVGIILIAAFADALSSAVSKRYNYELSSSIFAYNLIALAIFTPLALYTGAWRIATPTPEIIFSIFFIGSLFFALFGYVFYESLRLVKTSIASTSYLACSFITMILSAIFLGEAIEPSYILIAAFVVAGVLIQRFAPTANFNIGTFLPSRKAVKAAHYAPVFDVTSAFTNTKNADIYDTMKGGGRVLAFHTDWKGGTANFNPHMLDINSNGCVIFTDKHDLASNDELEFIREITGCTDDRLLVMGSGTPENVMDSFAKIRDLLKDMEDKKLSFPDETSPSPRSLI